MSRVLLTSTVDKDNVNVIKFHINNTFQNIVLKNLTINNNTDEIKRLTLSKIISLYLKYDLKDLLLTNIVSEITEEIFNDLVLRKIILEHSIQFSINSRKTNSQLVEFISQTYENMQSSNSRLSLIPQEYLEETTTSIEFIQQLLTNNYWYSVFYLTVAFIYDNEIYKSFLNNGVIKNG